MIGCPVRSSVMVSLPVSYVLINLNPQLGSAGDRVELVRRPRRENLVTRGQRDPGLLAAGPYMPCQSQPSGTVEGARAHPDQAIPRLAANPGAAFRAHQTSIDPPTVCSSLDRSRLNAAETKSILGHDNPHREGAAG